jgi:translocation and assembly module TamB
MPRWLKIFLLVLTLPVLALATLPWWFGAAASPVLRRWDITWQNYAADGYGRFRAEEIRYAHGSTTVIARGIEGSSPLRWLWPSSREISVKTWSVEVKASTAAVAGEPATIDGLPALHTLLQKISVMLQRWLPRATVGAGEVNWPLGGLTLAGATWQEGVLTAQRVNFLGQNFDLQVNAAHPGVFTAQADQPAQEARLQLEWRGDTVQGTGLYWNQPLTISATFPHAGWLPLAAEARAENWTVSSDRARLGALYTGLTGGGVITWRDQSFALSVQAKAEPKPGAKAPPLEGRIEARGDRSALTITALQVDAPFARATLSAPVVIGFNGDVRGESAQLAVDADLAKQTWVEASGKIYGSVAVTGASLQEFSLTLEGAAWRGVTVQKVVARGTWQWPRLTLTELDLQLDATSRVQAAGVLDWQTRELAGVKLDAVVQPAWFARWLPAGLTWAGGEFHGTLQGPLAAPRHTGDLRLKQASVGPLKPFDLAATWRGEGAALGEFAADVAAQTSRVHLAGAGAATGLELREFSFAPAGTEVLALAAPVTVDWSPVWRIAGARLQGGNASLGLDATGGAAGSFALTAANLDKEWVHDWLDFRGPTWRVSELQATGRIVDQLLHFTATASGEIQLPDRPVAQVTLAASGDQEGVRLTGLKITEAGRVVTQVTGRLPVTLAATAPYLRVAETAPFELQADAQPESPLWAALGEPVGVTLAGASAQAQLQGTLQAPKGDLRVTVASLAVAADSRWHARVPDVAGFALVASADRAQLRIDSLTAKVEGQEVRASAQLPMDDGRWRQLMSGAVGPVWREAEAHVEIPGADLAPLARRLPEFFAAQGRLVAKLDLTRGGNVGGTLRLTGAATRPLPALGVIQEINTTINFSGRAATITSFSARLGGEPVDLQGKVSLPAEGDPQLDLHLTGKNLPLVRRAGLLVRSDLDVRARSSGDVTTVSGLVTLRDCLVLSDLADVLPTGLRGVRRQPPYFSVEAVPFSRWPLAVEIRGPAAIRLRTPFFTGTASAHFNLGGTLGEPRAVGEVTVEDGRIFFPFATFTVQNGVLRLRTADPFHPDLQVNAISRRHNYELRLEATGAPEAPVLVFSSNPPLGAGDVLLMVMAGQIPANEATGTPGTGGLRLTQLGAYLGQGIYRGLGGSGENRLEIVSGERVSRQGRETYEVVYKLGEKWSLVGEYDEFDSYNGGVKWRIYTQEGSGGKN